MQAIYSARIQQALCFALVAATLVSSGCVRRRLTIRSNPPGALVYVDDYEIGTTPCSTSFTYYGTRQIRLVKDGYETLTVYEPIKAPSYQIPPLDFFSETASTTETRDERTLSYQLQPQVVVPGEILKARAEQLRIDARAPDATFASGLLSPTSQLPGPQLPGPSTSLGPGTLPSPPALQGPSLLGPALPPNTSPGMPIPETLPPGGQAPIFAPPRAQ